MDDKDIESVIRKEVKELYWVYDINCARTMMITLSKCLDFKLEKQLIHAGIGMHGAGGYRAQCGLVEGSLMFISVYLKSKGKADKEISDACFHFADRFKAKFKTLLCYDLRPDGFRSDDPPHLCEKITVESVLFTCGYLQEMK